MTARDLVAVAARQPDNIAAFDRDVAVTYRELDDAAGRLAATLFADGVRPGDRVGALLYNSSTYVEVYFAAYKIGAIPVNLKCRYRGAELARLISDASLKAVVYHGDLAENLRDALPNLAGIPRLITAGVDDFRTTEPVAHRVRPPDDRMFLYTGGTTGIPKAVIWSIGDQFDSIAYMTYTLAGLSTPGTAAEAADAAERLSARGMAPVTLPVARLMHGTAWTFATASVCVGGTLVFTGAALRCRQCRRFNQRSPRESADHRGQRHRRGFGRRIRPPRSGRRRGRPHTSSARYEFRRVVG